MVGDGTPACGRAGGWADTSSLHFSAWTFGSRGPQRRWCPSLYFMNKKTETWGDLLTSHSRSQQALCLPQGDRWGRGQGVGVCESTPSPAEWKPCTTLLSPASSPPSPPLRSPQRMERRPHPQCQQHKGGSSTMKTPLFFSCQRKTSNNPEKVPINPAEQRAHFPVN